MHLALRPLASILPIVFPSRALKDIIMKNYFNHTSIILGFTVSTSWIICSILGMVWVLKSRKFFAG